MRASVTLQPGAGKGGFDDTRIVIYVYFGVTPMSRKKISTTVYITPEQDAALKQLNAKTKVPVAEYIRQGIELVLAKYRDHLPGQQSLFDLK
jgi:hypothetical protein